MKRAVSRKSYQKPHSWRHYFTFYENKYGLLLKGFLKLFTSIRFPKEEQDILQSISRDGVVIHTLLKKNIFEAVMFHFYYFFNGLPTPLIAFETNLSLVQTIGHVWKSFTAFIRHHHFYRRPLDPINTGYAAELIRQGESMLVFAQDKRYFLKRYIGYFSDPFAFLLKMQQETEKTIYVLPQLVVWEKSPGRKHSSSLESFLGEKMSAGSFRRMLNLLIKRKSALIKYSEPINLRKVLNKFPDKSVEETALWLRQEAIARIEKERIIITGPVQTPRHEIFQKVLYDDEVNEKIMEVSASKKQTVTKTRKQAYKTATEIAADYNVNYIRMFRVALNYIFNNIFDGIETDEEGLAKVRRVARRSPIILVPSHKSHMDYLIISYVFFTNNIVPPHIAAGINLSFFPMGYIFRKSGAFFIRRTFKGQDLYRIIFKKYIETLIETGTSIEFFIEGGRSRTGRLVLPKLGFLSILFDVFQKGVANDLHFIPISITYDQVLEEKSHAKELTGGEKEKENVAQMLKSRKLLSRRYGKVYVTFDEPRSLRTYLDYRRGKGEMDDVDSMRFDFAYRIARAINRVVVITPFSLTAASVLTTARRGFTVIDLRSTTELFHDYLTFRNLNLANSIARKEHLESAIRKTLRNYAAQKKIRPIRINKKLVSEQGEQLYSVDEELRLSMEYYKNNILHYFLPISFTAVAFMAGGKASYTFDELLEDFYAMRNLFTYDFIFPVEDKSVKHLQQSLDYLLGKGYIGKEGELYTCIPRFRPTLGLFAGLIYNYFETYFIVAKSLKYIDRSKLSRSDFLERVQETGLILYNKGVITRPEALSRVSYQSAIDYMVNQKVIVEETEGAVKEGKKPEKFYTLTSERKTLNWRRLKRFRQIHV